MQCIYICIYTSTCRCTSVSVSISISVYTDIGIHVRIYLSIYLSVCLSVCLCVYLSTSWSSMICCTSSPSGPRLVGIRRRRRGLHLGSRKLLSIGLPNPKPSKEMDSRLMYLSIYLSACLSTYLYKAYEHRKYIRTYAHPRHMHMYI